MGTRRDLLGPRRREARARPQTAIFCIVLFLLISGICAGQELRITGGVGYRLFLGISRWLAEPLKREFPDLQIWIDYHETGRGFRDSVLALAKGDAELALVNSRAVAGMAMRGTGLFAKPVALRAIAVLPHLDWCFFAVDADLGIRSFRELREKRIPLRLATGFLGGDSAVTFTALELLRRHGIDLEEFERWGGKLLPGGPSANREAVRTGEANAVCQEGARGDDWEELLLERSMVFLPLEPEVVRVLEDELGVATITVPAHYYPSQNSSFRAVDFSGFYICVREDFDDTLAYRLAGIVVEGRRRLEEQYRSRPLRYASILYPLEVQRLSRTDPIPLHPGAARYYREHAGQ